MNIFYKNNTTITPSYTIGAMLGKTGTKGEVGIEIEIEGKNCPHEELGNLSKYWKHVVDHSLRGEDNGEYVLRKPIKFDEVSTSLDELWTIFADYNTKFDESNRTSVHVHLNCQSFHINRFASFSALYFCFEEILTEWCGEYRVGNLFCLRSKDAPAIVQKIRKFVKEFGSTTAFSEHLHYSAFNIHSLSKFGSVEIRTMRGVSDPNTILSWVNILRRLYDLSAEFTDPRKICDMFSAEGPMGFFYNVMGDQAEVVRSGIDFNDERIKDSMYEGIRLAQDICYCYDWDNFKIGNASADPFGRPLSKVLKYLALQSSSASLNASAAEWFVLPDTTPSLSNTVATDEDVEYDTDF